MKLSKDQKQKLVLGGMIVVGVIYAYFTFLLGPLEAARTAAAKNSRALDPKIAEAKTQLARVEALKKREPEAKVFIQQVESMIPGGSPIAWFPPRVVEFFGKFGVENVTTRPNSDPADMGLTGFKRMNWGIEVPTVQFMHFAAAVSALENAEPLIEIQAFEVEAKRGEAGKERAALTVTNLIRQ